MDMKYIKWTNNGPKWHKSLSNDQFKKRGTRGASTGAARDQQDLPSPSWQDGIEFVCAEVWHFLEQPQLCPISCRMLDWDRLRLAVALLDAVDMLGGVKVGHGSFNVQKARASRPQWCLSSQFYDLHMGQGKHVQIHRRVDLCHWVASSAMSPRFQHVRTCQFSVILYDGLCGSALFILDILAAVERIWLGACH